MLLFRRIVFRHRLGTMQRQHHADVSMHERPAIFCRHQNRFAMPVMGDRALHANGGIVTKVGGWVDPVSEEPVPEPTHWKAWGRGHPWKIPSAGFARCAPPAGDDYNAVLKIISESEQY
jgi:hypothetical protein